jgi:hypothetical protein
MKKVSDNEYLCIAERYDFVGESKVQLSANEQQWQTIENNVRFYNGPKVTSISPTYGETKNPKGSKLEITGDNFICPNSDCSKIKVRFQNERGDNILESGTMLSTGVIQCTIPKYPAPETLNVDISFNGQDFTNDGVKYGFMDPFILDVQPRLISSKGTTIVTVMGYGFVQMEDSKSMISLNSGMQSLKCSENSIC